MKLFLFLFFRSCLFGSESALITGINGQDGSYLAEYLLSQNFIVHGTVRSLKEEDHCLITHLLSNKNLILHPIDLLNESSVENLIEVTKPNQIYNLAAQSNIKRSFESPLLTANITALGIVRIGEACLKKHPHCKIFQPGSSELYGGIASENPHTFHPKNPYGIAKLYAFWMSEYYKKTHHLYISNGILFNHESPRRDESFISAKIIKALPRLLKNEQSFIELGNLNTRRDFGFAPDYVEAMHLMLNQPSPLNLVLATGKTHTIKEFIEAVFSYIDITLDWEGSDINEVARIKEVSFPWIEILKPGQVIIRINKDFFRPIEIHPPEANTIETEVTLNWKAKTCFSEMIAIMVDVALKEAGLPFKGHGINLLNERYPYLSHP